MTISLPFQPLQLVKILPFHIPEAWKKERRGENPIMLLKFWHKPLKEKKTNLFVGEYSLSLPNWDFTVKTKR